MPGQVDGWTALPSSFSVEVLDEHEIAAAVNFARDFNLRVNVKGTGKTVFLSAGPTTCTTLSLTQAMTTTDGRVLQTPSRSGPTP